MSETVNTRLTGAGMLPPVEPPKKPAAKNRKSTGDRFNTLNRFVDAAMATLSRAEIAVWLVLYRDTKRSGAARSSQGDIAHRSGCDARTVRRALKGLQRQGLVEELWKGGLGHGPSEYRVTGEGTPIPSTPEDTGVRL